MTDAERQANSRATRTAEGSKRVSMILDARSVRAIATIRGRLVKAGASGTDVAAVKWALAEVTKRAKKP